MTCLVFGAPRQSAAGVEFRTRYRALRKAIGRNITGIRRHQRMSLKSLSKKTGIGADKLDLYELGRAEITLAVIIRIAAALTVPTERLLDPECANPTQE